jgi:hypothetical protein
MFETAIHDIEHNSVTMYRLKRHNIPLSYSEVLDLWQADVDFRDYYTRLLADSPYTAFRWETPPLTQSTMVNPFEFVLINSPWFCLRQTDAKAFESYFTDAADQGIVSVANLSGDATLIIPSPKTDTDAYGHFAAFIRQAPSSQVDAMWGVIGTTVKSRIGKTPLWLSTAGGGVAWLHVRLDLNPKYYGYSPYTQIA